MVTLTPILRLNVPEFDQDPWDEDVNDNWQILDAAVGQNLSIPNLQGVWQNSHAYAVGQSAIDTDSQTYQCNVAHTSADPPTTFTQDRTAHPTYWTAITASAQFYANQAQGFADDAATSAAAAAASAASVGNPVPIAGNVTMTGPLTLSGDPTATFGAATKHYVDTHAPPAAASSDYINIKTDYGAKGDGTTDDTAAIQAMIAGVPVNAAVFWPAGTYLVSSPITVSKQMAWIGADRVSTIVRTASTTANMITLTACVNIRGMQFAGPATGATAGALLTYNTGAIRARLKEYWTTGGFKHIVVNGTSDLMFIDGQMFGWANGGAGIDYTGGEAMVIDDVIIQQGTRPGNGSGIIVRNGGMQLINSEVIACGTCLALIPGAGQAVVSMWVCNTAFDNAISGVLIQPSGSGVVERNWFVGCWMSSMDQSGVTIISPSVGAVNGIDFNNCHVFGNAVHGFNMADANARRLNFLGCNIAGNTQTGIQFFAGGAQFRISHCTIGAYGGFGNNGAGINLGGSSVSYQITDNDIANGNINPFIGAGVQSGPSPGITEVVYANVGYNSQSRGGANITAGGLSVTVAHALNGTPSLHDIFVTDLTGMGNPPQATAFIISPTSTTFTIEIGVALGFTCSFAWMAKLPCTP